MSSNTFTALSYLQNYADASEKAHEELKSCMWQLTKSRRNVRSGIIGVDSTTAYTAELLREELRAQNRVVDGGDNGEIDLVNEDSVQPPVRNKDDQSIVAPQWKLYDVLFEIEQTRRNTVPDNSSSSKNRTSDITGGTGMRYRKNNRRVAAATIPTSSDTNPSSSWTMVQEEDFNSDAQDDEQLIRTDPIKLFGGYFTARELKVAQRNARESLNGYIQAANEAAKLLELLRENKNSS